MIKAITYLFYNCFYIKTYIKRTGKECVSMAILANNSKTFDCVPHTLLLIEFETYGVKGFKNKICFNF